MLMYANGVRRKNQFLRYDQKAAMSLPHSTVRRLRRRVPTRLEHSKIATIWFLYDRLLNLFLPQRRLRRDQRSQRKAKRVSMLAMECINRVNACDLKSQKNVVSDDEFQHGWNTPKKKQKKRVKVQSEKGNQLICPHRTKPVTADAIIRSPATAVGTTNVGR